ncbi:MAG TPA: ATP-dependent DNA helicase RecG [Candidatus Bathyarchaeia archaeon]|nr:ATP-dependent DNA helicase RecG [Candidatus Bathyarchaeia archaeon]
MTPTTARSRAADDAPATSLDLPVTRIPGIGSESAKLLERMNIHSIGDLLWHLPSRFDDFSKFVPLRRLMPNATQTAVATLGRISQRRTATGKLMTEAELAEEDGTPTDVRATWFGRAFVKETHREGERVRISGKVRFFGRTLQFSQPTLERADAEAVHTGRLVPIYPLTEGIKPGQMRRWLHTAIEGGTRRTGLVSEVPEPLPPGIRERHHLPDIASALRQVHFPDDVERLFAARRRLAFDELLVLQLALAQRRARWKAQASALPLAVNDAELSRWIAELPFALTGAQQESFDEIRADLGKRIPMSRLLEGDVGSGKTVVAALAARIAAASGAQTALMAPTELLAEQHDRSLAALFANGGPTHALLTSSVTGERRREILAGLADGSIDVAVGTHALVEENVVFKRLGLAVVDEQHRFGVRQRATFREKGTGADPHLLLTTATPIPQTLNQTIYRDLDISVIDEMPLGRKPIITHLRTPEHVAAVWEGVRLAVKRGQQAFVVTPRIDPAEEGGDDVPSAIATEQELRQEELRGLRIALMHGRMAAKERDSVMRRFANGEVDVLVATTVIEVGIDIPNATVMVVLGAERFGLAQLHQLRGRIGRGSERSYCVLVSDASDSERLAAMVEMKDGRPIDGFELAKRDLAIRGAGEFLGARQHGVPELRIVNLADVDPELISETAEEADRVLAGDPELARAEHAELSRAVDQLWRRYALA